MPAYVSIMEHYGVSLIMAFQEFGFLMSGICAHTSLAIGRPLLWTIIANPKAGGFTIKSRWKKHHELLTEMGRRAGNNPLRKGGPSKTAGNALAVLQPSVGYNTQVSP